MYREEVEEILKPDIIDKRYKEDVWKPEIDMYSKEDIKDKKKIVEAFTSHNNPFL